MVSPRLSGGEIVMAWVWVRMREDIGRWTVVKRSSWRKCCDQAHSRSEGCWNCRRRSRRSVDSAEVSRSWWLSLLSWGSAALMG